MTGDAGDGRHTPIYSFFSSREEESNSLLYVVTGVTCVTAAVE